jgi:hypothetical protein
MYPLAAAVLLIAGPWAAPQSPSRLPATRSRPLPGPQAVAETRLLMEGLADANFKGLERVLRMKPTDTEAWTFARGQALLIAETGNLLMLRPPRNDGRAIWLERASDLRNAAAKLARATAAQDYDESRSALNTLATTCNRCHQTFRASVRVTPFGEPAPPVPSPPKSTAPRPPVP